MAWRRLVVVLASGAVALALGGCGDDGDGGGDGQARQQGSQRPGDPCELISAAEISEIVGVDLERASASGSGTFGKLSTETCAYQAGLAGGTLLSVSVQSLAFDTLETVEAELEPFGAEPAEIDELPDTSLVTVVSGLRTIWVAAADPPFAVSVSTVDGEELTDRPAQARRLAVAVYDR